MSVQEVIDSLDATHAADQSVEILDKIFGSGWIDLIPGSGVASEATSIIFPMLEKMNMIVIVCVCCIGMWSVIRGAIGTAHEGEFLGKAFHTIWAPIRFALATMFVAPVPIFNGLCMAQILIMGAIGLSVNCGNWIWQGAVDFFEESGGQLVIEIPDTTRTSLRTTAAGIMESATILEFMRVEKGISVSNVVNIETIPGGRRINLPIANVESLQPGDLGAIEIPCDDTVFSDICDKKVVAICKLYEGLQPLSFDLVLGEPVDGEKYVEVLDDFEATAAEINTERMKKATERLQEELATFAETAKNDGWMSAGGYYWTMARINDQASRDFFGELGWSPPNLERLATLVEVPVPMPSVQAFLEKSNRYRADALREAHITSATAGSSDEPMGAIKEIHDNLNSWAVTGSIDQIMEGGDPILALSHLGNGIIEGTSAMVLTYLLARGGASAAEKAVEATAKIPIISSVTGGVSGFVGGVLRAAGPFLTMLAFSAYSLGFLLCFYFPFLPYFLWTMALLSWFILCIESLVAGPLWFAVHSLPEGEGLVHERGKAGYLLLMSICLGPPLMVMSLVFAQVLTVQITPMIAEGFKLCFISVQSQTTGTWRVPLISNAIWILGSLALFVTMMLLISHKIFGLITHLPNHCMRWIGQSAGVGMLGDSGAEEHRIRGAVAAVAAESKGGARQGAAMGAKPNSITTDSLKQSDKKDEIYR